MADELDAMLQGDDNSSASQAKTDNQQAGSGEIKPLENQSEEEVEFNKLSGSAQDRVRELIRQRREAEERANASQQSVPTYSNSVTPDQKQALETLANFGVATDDKVDRKIGESINQLRREMELTRLEQKFTGNNGEPKFDREEVKDFIETHPQYKGYTLEDVYRYKMFPDEFSNLQMQKATKTGRSSSLRPTKSLASNETLTPEYIESRLKQPDGQEWYTENLNKINDVLANMAKPQ